MTKEIKDQFAILYVQAARFHPICSKLDWPDALRKLYRKHDKKLEAFAAKHFPQEVAFRGYCEDEDIEHYEIDEAIRKNFDKKDVQPDSEGGGFYCYTNEETEGKLKAFLTKKFPDLEFSVSRDSDCRIKPFVNWDDAEKYVEENNIEVPPIFSGINLILKKLEEFESKIKKIEEEREKYIKNIGIDL